MQIFQLPQISELSASLLNCNTDAEGIIDNSPGFQSGEVGIARRTRRNAAAQSENEERGLGVRWDLNISSDRCALFGSDNANISVTADF